MSDENEGNNSTNWQHYQHQNLLQGFLKALLKKLALMWRSAFHSNSWRAETSALSSLPILLRAWMPLSTEQAGVKRIKWVLHLLKLSFFSPLVRHVSRCLLIKCRGTLTEHTGHSTAEGDIKANMVIIISDCSSKLSISHLQLCCGSCVTQKLLRSVG